MNTINFYNESRQEVMIFSNFSVQKNEPNFDNFVSFTVNVNYANFKGTIVTECLQADIENLFRDLQKMYNFKIQTILFIPNIEKQIGLKFNLLENGYIKVAVELLQNIFGNNIYTAKLQFEYGINQSFLPELIGEFSTVLANANFK
ncbi:MAG: hypothetical protein PHH23_05085 [Paludibacteraceae bacterium]|nr:hypothetical protein [Paludibacteraceae bacterium]